MLSFTFEIGSLQNCNKTIENLQQYLEQQIDIQPMTSMSTYQSLKLLINGFMPALDIQYWDSPSEDLSSSGVWHKWSST